MAQLNERGQISTQFYYKFPWLNGSSEILFSLYDKKVSDNFSLVEAVKFLFSRYLELESRINTFFMNAIESKEEITTSTEDETNLAMYPLLQIIINLLGNRILANALSNIYAKNCQFEIERQDKRTTYTDTFLRNVCINLNIVVEIIQNFTIDNTLFPFKISFQDYLFVAANIKDNVWKLINRPLRNGSVYLIRHDLVMLLREFVRKKTLPSLNELDKETEKELEKIPEISNILQKIDEKMKSHVKKFQSDLLSNGETVGSDYFPPCIRAILHKAVIGENMGHYERLSIAFFFLNTNHTIEETCDIFRTMPDFDEKTTRYQVDFAAGSGKGKKYTMFNCVKLKTLKICKADDSQYGESLCAKGAKKKDGTIVPIVNPARDYIFWKKVELNRVSKHELAVNEPVIESQKEEEKNK